MAMEMKVNGSHFPIGLHLKIELEWKEKWTEMLSLCSIQILIIDGIRCMNFLEWNFQGFPFSARKLKDKKSKG